MNRCPSMTALAKFLATNPPKGKNQFEDENGRCCLGHYAAMCRFPIHAEQIGFYPKTTPGYPKHGDSVLPEGHWLFEIVDEKNGFTVQQELQDLNDFSDTFEPIVDYLLKRAEKLQAAGREAAEQVRKEKRS